MGPYHCSMDKAIDQMERIFQLSPTSSAASVEAKGERLTPVINPLFEVLMGRKLPSNKVPYTDLQFLDQSLNASQQAAVRFALESPEIALIHGPPGVSELQVTNEVVVI